MKNNFLDTDTTVSDNTPQRYPPDTKSKKSPASVCSSSTLSSSTLSLIPTPDSYLYSTLISGLPSSLLANTDLTCTFCNTFQIFFIYFPCAHSFCLNCYLSQIIPNQLPCPKCQLPFQVDSFALKNQLIENFLNKNIQEPQSFKIYNLLLARLNLQYSDAHSAFWNKQSESQTILFEQNLPIYSQLWSESYESQFIERFENLTEDQKLEELKIKGLNNEFIEKAKENELDLVIHRTSLNLSQSDLTEKRSVLHKVINK